jgi:alkylation response protein AidB-like acyl-CoA dehydrogenase
MKIHQPGVTVEQIRQVDGSMEFCQEFFDDVPIPASDVVGEVDDGWTVATHLLAHERHAVGGGSPYLSGRYGNLDEGGGDDRFLRLARSSGRADDGRIRSLTVEGFVRQLVGRHLVARVTAGMASGKMPPAAGSLLKLFSATNNMRRSEISLEIAGIDAAVFPADRRSLGEDVGEASLLRQGLSLGGGSNEIQRNIISERLLGMPREFAADRDVPYREVRRAPKS